MSKTKIKIIIGLVIVIWLIILLIILKPERNVYIKPIAKVLEQMEEKVHPPEDISKKEVPQVEIKEPEKLVGSKPKEGMEDIKKLTDTEKKKLAKKYIKQLIKAFQGKYSNKPVGEYENENLKMLLEAGGEIRKLGEIAGPYIMEYVKNKSYHPMLRDMLIELAGLSRNKDILQDLIEIISDKSEPKNIRIKAISSIGMIGDKEAIDFLLEILSNERDESLQSSATFALGAMKDRVAVNALVNVINDDKYGQLTRNRAIMTIGMLWDKKIVDEFMNLSEDERKKVSDADEVMFFLTEYTDEVVNALIDALKDGTLRAKAIQSLGRIGDKRAVEPLLELLEKEKGSWEYASIIESLGNIRDERAIDTLTRIVDEGDLLSAEDASIALCKIGNSDPLFQMINRARESKEPNMVNRLKKAYNDITGKQYEE